MLSLERRIRKSAFRSIKTMMNTGELQQYKLYRLICRSQYCSRKIRRLRLALRMTPPNEKTKAKGKKSTSFPGYRLVTKESVIKDPQYLLLLLFEAERAWAYGLYLRKLEVTEHRKVFHARKRFKRAAFLASQLVRLIKEVSSLLKQTQSEDSSSHSKLLVALFNEKLEVESQAYASYMKAQAAFESEAWDQAVRSFEAAEKLYSILERHSEGPDDAADYAEKTTEISPLLRYSQHQKAKLRSRQTADLNKKAGKDLRDNTSMTSAAEGEVDDALAKDEDIAVSPQSSGISVDEIEVICKDFMSFRTKPATRVFELGDLEIPCSDPFLTELIESALDAGPSNKRSQLLGQAGAYAAAKLGDAQKLLAATPSEKGRRRVRELEGVQALIAHQKLCDRLSRSFGRVARLASAELAAKPSKREKTKKSKSKKDRAKDKENAEKDSSLMDFNLEKESKRNDVRSLSKIGVVSKPNQNDSLAFGHETQKDPCAKNQSSRFDQKKQVMSSGKKGQTPVDDQTSPSSATNKDLHADGKKRKRRGKRKGSLKTVGLISNISSQDLPNLKKGTKAPEDVRHEPQPSSFKNAKDLSASKFSISQLPKSKKALKNLRDALKGGQNELAQFMKDHGELIMEDSALVADLDEMNGDLKRLDSLVGAQEAAQVRDWPRCQSLIEEAKRGATKKKPNYFHEKKSFGRSDANETFDDSHQLEHMNSDNDETNAIRNPTVRRDGKQDSNFADNFSINDIIASCLDPESLEALSREYARQAKLDAQGQKETIFGCIDKQELANQIDGTSDRPIAAILTGHGRNLDPRLIDLSHSSPSFRLLNPDEAFEPVYFKPIFYDLAHDYLATPEFVPLLDGGTLMDEEDEDETEQLDAGDENPVKKFFTSLFN